SLNPDASVHTGGDRPLELPLLEKSAPGNREMGLCYLNCGSPGWYWGPLTAAEARRVLCPALEGSFLMRDSSSPDNLLTLSVKTSVGPTHIRICYSAGRFGFDSSVLAKPKLRSFKDAMALVQFYSLASLKQAERLGPLEQEIPSVSEDPAIHLKLIKPLYVSVPALQHLCRLTINRSARQVTALPLPVRLKDYLLKYPYVL
uniref:Cytokine-inducible SH2-containing protein n=1 Tax=Chelydra serpentina TaxID=8475 RepID=A0A8C3RK74_CHESE